MPHAVVFRCSLPRDSIRPRTRAHGKGASACNMLVPPKAAAERLEHVVHFLKGEASLPRFSATASHVVDCRNLKISPRTGLQQGFLG